MTAPFQLWPLLVIRSTVLQLPVQAASLQHTSSSLDAAAMGSGDPKNGSTRAGPQDQQRRGLEEAPLSGPARGGGV
jgi:hypothetical protein